MIDLAQGWSGAMGTRSRHADLVAMVAGVYIYIKRGKLDTHTLPELLDAFEVQLRGAPHAVPAMQESQSRPPRSSPTATNWLSIGKWGAFGVRRDLSFALMLARNGCSHRHNKSRGQPHGSNSYRLFSA